MEKKEVSLSWEAGPYGTDCQHSKKKLIKRPFFPRFWLFSLSDARKKDADKMKNKTVWNEIITQPNYNSLKFTCRWRCFTHVFVGPGQLLFLPTDHQIRIAIWKVSLLQTLTFIECRIPNASEPNQYAKIDRFTLFCYVDIVVNVTFNRELKIKYINIYRKKSRIESWQEGSKQMKQIPKSCPKSNWNIRWEEIFHTDHTKINMDCRNARITNNRSNQNPWQISRKETK